MKNHGGKRTGAGRPKGTGQYGTATKVMRVPESKVEDVKAFLAITSLYMKGRFQRVRLLV